MNLKLNELKKPVRLKVINNWESLYWEIDQVEVTAALRMIRLGMPDGTVQDFKVTWTEHNEPYYDMGHRCSASQLNAFIVLEVNGLKLKTNLNDIKSKVKVIAYKIRRPQ